MKRAILFLAWLAFAACSPKPDTNSALRDLPSFQLTLLTGEKMMANDLPGRTILIFYNPDCDHCQREAEEISFRLADFKNYTLYFIAASPDENVRLFAEKYDLLGKGNVLFAKAEVPDVIREMGPMSSPSLYIYSDGKQLIKKFDGETAVEEIIKAL